MSWIWIARVNIIVAVATMIIGSSLIKPSGIVVFIAMIPALVAAYAVWKADS